MDNSTYDSEQISRWLDGEMTGDEKTSFEKTLADDQQLQSEVNTLRVAREAIRSYGLQQKVAAVHEEMMKEMQVPMRMISSRRRIIRYTISVAASILLIFIGITAYNFFSLSPARLYAQQYTSYELPTTRGGESSAPIEKLYKEKNYRAVIEGTSQLSKNSIEENFLAGASYLEVNNPGAAITLFQEVINKNRQTGESQYQEQAEYYLALAYLKNKNYEKAVKLMQAIHNNPNHSYHEKFSKTFIRKVKMLSWR
jgi:tetratricopeptide (TPR) repeat protein